MIIHRAAAFALLAATFAETAFASFSTSPSTGADVLPGGYLVEFADDAERGIAQEARTSKSMPFSILDEFHAFMTRSIAATNDHVSKGEQLQREVLGDLGSALAMIVDEGGAARNVSALYSVRRSWDHEGLFRGVSVQLVSDQYAALLTQAPGVVRVSPIHRYRAPSVSGSLSAASDGIAKLVARDDASTSSSAMIGEDSLAARRMIGVDRLHAEGVLGQGMTIGIIDTGIDYTHPALNGGKPAGTPCFGKPECQVIGGRNLANVGNPNDPFSDCDGHGTIVASVAAGRSSAQANITG